MAGAIVKGLLHSGYPPALLSISARHVDNLASFAAEGIQTTDDNVLLVKTADVVVFAVKPHQIEGVCELVKTALPASALLVSIASGLTTDTLSGWLGQPYPIVRAMPNTPAMVNAGATGLFATAAVTPSQRDFIESVFRSVGVVAWVSEESQIPMVTALSGSGPAYYFRLMEAMEKKALAFGLPHDMVKLFVTQTVLGAAKLAAECPEDFAVLREQVTSPKGTTEQGLRVLAEVDVDRIMGDVMEAVLQRAHAISKELSC